MKKKAYLTTLPDFIEIQRASFCWFLEKGLSKILVPKEYVFGKFLAQDVFNAETGEVFAEAGDERRRRRSSDRAAGPRGHREIRPERASCQLPRRARREGRGGQAPNATLAGGGRRGSGASGGAAEGAAAADGGGGPQ